MWLAYLSGARWKWFSYGPVKAHHRHPSSSLASFKCRIVCLYGAGLARLSDQLASVFLKWNFLNNPLLSVCNKKLSVHQLCRAIKHQKLCSLQSSHLQPVTSLTAATFAKRDGLGRSFLNWPSSSRVVSLNQSISTITITSIWYR